ncbi:hypothetical protein ABW20_dc0110189 [Dactylellina cionopaga]|nr:hypothetical protein ABW20_dc0110189 [Dactylellina cionopaga]
MHFTTRAALLFLSAAAFVSAAPTPGGISPIGMVQLASKIAPPKALEIGAAACQGENGKSRCASGVLQPISDAVDNGVAAVGKFLATDPNPGLTAGPEP